MSDSQEKNFIKLTKKEGNNWRSIKSIKEYHFSGKYGTDKLILDYGCGPGYGSEILANYANKVIGVDIREKPLNYARNHRKANNLSFKRISTTYPHSFENQSFDIIVLSHVIEHLPNVRATLKELKRLLKTNGKLIINTPNRKFRLLPLQKPFNPDHKREYTLRSFRKELTYFFRKVEICGVYGTEEINRIERLRMKRSKNPIKVYLINPIMFFLKKILSRELNLRIIEFEERLNRKVISSSFNILSDFNTTKSYTLDDVCIGNELKKSFDFLAVCHK